MTIYYPDVYSGDAGISFTGALIAMVKATEGTGYTNPDYTPAKGRAAAAGSFFCAYHFLHQGNAAAQAQYCFSVVGKGIPLMLDFEPWPNINSYPTIADAEAFIDEYRKLGGTVYFLYLPKWYWQGTLGGPSLEPLIQRDMLLVSSDYTTYTDSNSGAGWQPYGGMTPAVWQYTSTASFNGRYPIDFNAYRGTLAEFKALATTGALADPVLQLGDSGPAVVTLQKRLNVWGANPQIATDGVFGPATLAAVKAFQSAHRITVDGIVGPATWAALNKTPAPAPYEYGAPQHLVAAPGRTSFRARWDAPAVPKGEPAPAEYLFYLYDTTNGAPCNTKTVLDSYNPRTFTVKPGEALEFQGDGLDDSRKHEYTIHVVATGPNGSHVKPFTFASAVITIG